MPFQLVSAAEGSEARAPSFDLRDGVTLIVGRALTSDVPIFDPTISRRHAEVTCDPSTGRVEIKDLASSNGTFVNGHRVGSANVGPGDVVAFGKVAFRLVALSARANEHILEQARKPVATRSAGSSDVSPPAGSAKIVRPITDPSADAPVLELAGPGQKNEQKLALLLEISKGLTRTPSVDTLLDKIAGFCLQIFGVDYVSILLIDEREEYTPKVARDRLGQAAQRTVPQSIIRPVVQDKVAILSDNAPEDVRFGGESILLQRVRSTMCAPLIGSDGRVLGVLYVDNVTATHRVNEEDLDFLAAFAGIAAAAIENGQFSEHIRHELLVRSNFERYFAPSLAARIANAPETVKLGGDKRRVAVLFSDIRGFTALSEFMNPDEIARLLSEYFTEMVDCVFRHGGTLDKFIGDAVMAQWGAPIATAEDTDRAMDAALDMMGAVATLNARRRAEAQPELGVGIGINFGEVFAGNIGSERRMEFTVIGDTVNTANRLAAAAEAGDILITESVRQALHRAPQLEERVPLELKGKANAVPVYRVVPR